MYYDNIAQTYGAFVGWNGGKYQVEDIMAFVHIVFSLNGSWCRFGDRRLGLFHSVL